jgi:hypothetical protein
MAALTEVLLDLDTTLNKRLYWTRRLLYGLRRSDNDYLGNAVRKYDEAITLWNERRNSFQIRLAGLIGTSAWQEFEHDLAPELLRIGAELERSVRALHFPGGSWPERQYLNETEQRLNVLSHSIYAFSRSIYNRIQRKEASFYSLVRSKRLPANDDELDSVSTWFLLKSLFIPIGMTREES